MQNFLEIGCGMAYLSDIHPGWCGAEYSRTAVQRVKKGDGNHIRFFEEDDVQQSYLFQVNHSMEFILGLALLNTSQSKSCP